MNLLRRIIRDSLLFAPLVGLACLIAWAEGCVDRKFHSENRQFVSEEAA